MNLIITYLPHYHLAEWGEISYQHTHDSGFDLRAAIDTPVCLKAGERVLIPTGILCELKPQTEFDALFSYEIQVRPRSGLAIKHGISVVNTPGTVDFGYRGEIKVILINLGTQPVTIAAGDRIAQGVVCPLIHPVIQTGVVNQNTDRGAGGFGSTGKG